MTNEEISTAVVQIFEPRFKEEAVKAAQDFIRVHAQIFGLSPEDPLAPIAEHLLSAAEKIVDPSFSNTPMTNYRPYGTTGLF